MAVGIFWVLTYNSVNYRMTWLIKSEEVEYRFFFITCIYVYVCMYVYHMHAMPVEVRSGPWMPQNWS